MKDIEEIIQNLKLKPHPEGGYFRETYRSAGTIDQKSLGNAYSGLRNQATCIYFLLTSKAFSAFHKIRQDEIWHFYKGSPIELHMISPNGDYSKVRIGNSFNKGEVPQFVVPGGYWFAAETLSKGAYSLVGCTVSPGFDFKDFVLGNRQKLLSKFPQHSEIISRFTRV
ncbi:cupin domain-containing protein [Ulvibacterium marinum]|uniref:cupin domain-containing protein n=1 Tax=Ulvibacterium marinum TaxID=2419782 RepID=UPI0024956633|nr:cupin domain-containing protein [Ulvibacterium marinum]